MQELRRRAAALVRDAAMFASAEFMKNTPRETGKLSKHISAPHQLGEFKWGVGKLSRLGDIDQPAPRGTISAFLDWYRATRASEND